MSQKPNLYLSASVLTAPGIFSGNFGEGNQSNFSALQHAYVGESDGTHVIVSAPCLRYTWRTTLQYLGEPVNRVTDFDSNVSNRQDLCDTDQYIDDNIFGYLDLTSKKKQQRTSPLGVAPGISLTPSKYGTTTFNTTSLDKKENKKISIYQQQQIYTRFQWGFNLSVNNLINPCETTIKLLTALFSMASAPNKAKAAYSFAPESIILRWSPSPLSNLLGLRCFHEKDGEGYIKSDFFDDCLDVINGGKLFVLGKCVRSLSSERICDLAEKTSDRVFLGTIAKGFQELTQLLEADL